jgi:hypothetical protein
MKWVLLFWLVCQGCDPAMHQIEFSGDEADSLCIQALTRGDRLVPSGTSHPVLASRATCMRTS